jgi:Prokaryotic Cytochrome C oxidase subunit IV
MQEQRNEKLSQAFRIGMAVFLILIAFTIGEFFIGAIAVNWSWPLWGIALIKAALIIRDYMHLPRVFAGSEEGNE